MVKNVRKGDTVITSGGLVGRVTKVVDDDQIEVEIADGVRVRQMRSMVTDVRAKGEPVKDDETQELIADRRGSERRRNVISMMLTSRWKALATLLTALFVCLFAVPNFFREQTLKSWPKWAQRHVVLGLDLQGGSHILLEVDLNDVRKQKAERCATTCAASCASTDRLYRAASIRGTDRRGAHPRGQRLQRGADQAARTLAAARRPPERDRPALGRGGRCRQRR